MHYDIAPATITFFIENPKNEIPSKAKLSYAGTRLTKENLVRICSAVTRQGQGKRPTTQHNYLTYFLRPVLAYFRVSGSVLPTTSNEWQLFLLYFFQYYLADTAWSTASASTRMSYWTTLVMGVFKFWVAEEILPCDVIIPTIRLKQVQSIAVNQQLLGQMATTPTPVAEPPQKLLVSVNFGAPDADYLDVVERTCREKINVIKDVCHAHWNALMHDGRTGEHFATLARPSEIAAAIKAGQYAQQIRGGGLTPLASPAHPQGHVWALAISKQLLHIGGNRDCVSIQALLATKFFAKKTFKAVGYGIFKQHTAMPLAAFNQLTAHGQYCRFMGILSALDASVACCLLTIEHPEFTSDALQSARLLNSRGKSHLLLTDNAESSILSLDKPRAARRKTVALTPDAQKLLMDIIAWTAPVRDVLKKAGDKGWRYLFLGFGRSGRLGPLNPAARNLSSERRTFSLTRFYPLLIDHGLTAGTFDFRRIRTTMGVLWWFETGSIQEMSRRLGNSNRIVLEHYLPAALLHAWNTRIIRRFQNTLIVLAAHGEDYLLEVTDFTSISDLQHFIAQLVLEYPGNSSPLAKEVQARLHSAGQTGGNSVDCLLGDGVLNIRLSAISLSYLYAFCDFAVGALTLDELCRVDTHSKLAPVQFVDLARLIRHACENDQTAADLRELLDLPRLRLMHERATTQQATLAKQFTKLSLSKQWEKPNV